MIASILPRRDLWTRLSNPDGDMYVDMAQLSATKSTRHPNNKMHAVHHELDIQKMILGGM